MNGRKDLPADAIWVSDNSARNGTVEFVWQGWKYIYKRQRIPNYLRRTATMVYRLIIEEEMESGQAA